jgi:P27 family predicted phage terminase small subunit
MDSLALAMLVESYSRWEQARRTVDEYGDVIEEPIVNKQGEIVGKRLVKNPAISHMISFQSALHKLGVEFGLTPAGRNRLKLPKKPVEDEFTKMMNTRKHVGFRPGPDPSVCPPATPPAPEVVNREPLIAPALPSEVMNSTTDTFEGKA